MSELRNEWLVNYPFAELGLLGWKLVDFAPAILRPYPGADWIRVAHFAHRDRTLAFDVDRYGQMSNFATFASGDHIAVMAETPQAALLLAATAPGVGVDILWDVPEVTPFRPKLR